MILLGYCGVVIPSFMLRGGGFLSNDGVTSQQSSGYSMTDCSAAVCVSINWSVFSIGGSRNVQIKTCGGGNTRSTRMHDSVFSVRNRGWNNRLLFHIFSFFQDILDFTVGCVLRQRHIRRDSDPDESKKCFWVRHGYRNWHSYTSSSYYSCSAVCKTKLFSFFWNASMAAACVIWKQAFIGFFERK